MGRSEGRTKREEAASVSFLSDSARTTGVKIGAATAVANGTLHFLTSCDQIKACVMCLGIHIVIHQLLNVSK